ncbi:MAG: energy-coupling factor transporter transmembrane protein EcfT [Alphaproteobacteria bacterium]|nr:energy-coupling factor transporter transmembrane protein EcfT [Alphaproteobacteria bacterium]
MDPRTRLWLVICAGVLAVTLERPAALLAFAATCAAPMLWLRPPWAWWRRGLIATATILWSTTLSQGLFYAEQPRVAWAVLGPLTLWREGLSWGLAQSLRFVGTSLAGLTLALSTPPDRMYAALLRLRVPFGLALMASTALRFVPEVGRELWVVRRARAGRGRPVWRRSPWAWLRLEVQLLGPVVARAWRRAQNLAESLDARGFDPLAPRAVRRPLRFSALDIGIIAASGALTLGVAGARILYVLYTSDTWYHPALRPLYGFVRGWL